MTDPFDGRWELDTAAAKVWDAQTQTHVPDEVGLEVITISVQDGVQDYEVVYGDNPTIRMGYRTPYDVAEWAPYAVREISVPDGQDAEASVKAFARRIKADSGSGSRQFEVGANYGLVRLVYVDERTHYRVAKYDDGSPQAILLRRLSEDGSSYSTSLMDVDGVVFRIRPFRRVA